MCDASVGLSLFPSLSLTVALVGPISPVWESRRMWRAAGAFHFGNFLINISHPARREVGNFDEERKHAWAAWRLRPKQSEQRRGFRFEVAGARCIAAPVLIQLSHKG